MPVNNIEIESHDKGANIAYMHRTTLRCIEKHCLSKVYTKSIKNCCFSTSRMTSFIPLYTTYWSSKVLISSILYNSSSVCQFLTHYLG